jgi:uncharacterized caspase-like protein
MALVIGNSAYQNVGQLTNPTNDAKLIADALRQDGFRVATANDLDRESLVKALKSFGDEADTADWAVVYFAGHGIEVSGMNYLIPVDAKLLTDRDIDFEAVSLKQVMHEIDGAHSLRVVILDACRNNPFERTMKRTAGEGRDIGRGLLRIEPDRGTLVVYSAKEGTIATDGDGADNPFCDSIGEALDRHGCRRRQDVSSRARRRARRYRKQAGALSIRVASRKAGLLFPSARRCRSLAAATSAAAFPLAREGAFSDEYP